MSTWAKEKKRDCATLASIICIYAHRRVQDTVRVQVHSICVARGAPIIKLGRPGRAGKIRYPTFTPRSFNLHADSKDTCYSVQEFLLRMYLLQLMSPPQALL